MSLNPCPPVSFSDSGFYFAAWSRICPSHNQIWHLPLLTIGAAIVGQGMPCASLLQFNLPGQQVAPHQLAF